MYMPLESLINKLKQNGFSIRPDDYIEILKVIERFQPATLQEAGNLICPLIVNSPEEQERFGVVFRRICEEDEQDEGERKNEWWKKVLDFLRKHRWWTAGIIAAINIAGAIIIFIPKLFSSSTNESDLRPVISLSDPNGSTFRIGDTLGFDVYQSFRTPSDSTRVNWEWNFGKGWGHKNEKYLTLVAADTGRQTARLRFLSTANNEVVADTSMSYTVCQLLPQPTLVPNEQVNIELRDTVTVSSTMPESELIQYNTVWLVNDDTVARYKPSIKFAPDTAGTYRVTFIIQSSTGDAMCNYETSVSYIAVDPEVKTFSIIPASTGDALEKPLRMKNWIGHVLAVMLFAAAIAGFIMGRIDKRRKRHAANALAAATETAAPAVKKPPYEIPMENRQHQLVASEQAMNDVIRFMHQRTRDEALALNIPQTVQNTIRTGGIPDLVYSNRLRPNDYLIVIDSRVSNSQQLKLFDYLVGTFRNESMSVIHFYYKDNFSTFYNKQYPSGLTLKRLTELYKEFTLIIYGTGHHLIYDAYPTINADRFNELADWENKAILTPVPYQDWSIKEKLIGQQMILLPADAEGQLRLIKAINEKMLRHGDYLSSPENFYSATAYDFTDTADIKAYLNDEDLFQCICAIAIYPGIRWEVLIELSKAVLDVRDCPEKLNYTTLLKFVRISWLHEGYFPEQTRLDLLKQLGVKEEIAARKSLIELLTYADVNFKDQHYFSDEKKMQEIANKFVVYANDPAHHENYLPAKEQFEALWRNNKITDAPLKKYLDNTGKKKWETPIRQNDKAVGTGDYFKKEGTVQSPPPALAKWSDRLKTIAGICMALLIALNFAGDNLAETKFAAFLRMNTVDSSRKIPVTIMHGDYGYCLAGIQDSLDYKSLQLALFDRNNKTIAPTDSAKGKYSYALRYADLVQPLLLEARWSVVPPSRMITPKTAYGNVSGSIRFTTNTVQLRISGCDEEVYPPIEIVHTYSARAIDEANRLVQNLSVSGFKRIARSTGATGDSVVVQYYDVNNEMQARSLADTISRYINYQVGVALINDSSKKGYTVLLPEINTSEPSTTCMIMPIEKLPGSLTEIWKGQRSNRYITINLPRKRIWYSTGDKKSFGIYNMQEVCQRGNQYKLITVANGRYKNFYIRNIANERFELSACQGFLPSLAAARADTSDCNNYDVMQLYYEQGPPADLVDLYRPRKVWVFYLTYSGERLYQSQSYKLNTYLSMAKERGIGKVDLNGVLVDPQFTNTSAQAYFDAFTNYFRNFIADKGMQLGKPDFDGGGGTPFDRNYFWLFDPGEANETTTINANAINKTCGRIVNNYLHIRRADRCVSKDTVNVAGETTLTLQPGSYTAGWEIMLDSVDASRYRNIMVTMRVVDGDVSSNILNFGNAFSNTAPTTLNRFAFQTLDFVVPAAQQADKRIKLVLLHYGHANINLRRITVTKK